MYLAIEGVIGVGKTSLVRMLQPLFQAEPAGGLRGESVSFQLLRRPRALRVSDADILFALALPPAESRRAAA